MLQNNIIEESHGINAVTQYDKQNNNVEFTPGEYAKVDVETFIKIDPEVIVVPNYAKFSIDDLYNDSRLQNMRAIQNKQIFMFPCKLEPWDYSTLSSCLAICYTTHKLHPDLYSHEKLMQTCDKFYQTLYNKTFSEEQLGI